jgi:LacI family transcriptional regulator
MLTISKKPTLKEIALLTNTSINTVSRALNGKEGVNKKTRELIMRVAAERRYRPNMLARSMRGSATNLLGIIVGDISNTFFVRLLEGIEEVTNREDITMAIGNSSENPGKESKYVDAFLSYQCAGVIITPVAGNYATIYKLKEENVNFVVLDRPLPEDLACDHVVINNKGDSIRAVEHFIHCGHKDIAIINPLFKLQTEQDRYLGYEEALKKHGIDVRPEYVKICESPQGAYQACLELIALPRRPSAVFIARNTFGLGVISAISDAGLHIPEDFSVILFGDPEWASVFKPTLTCVQQPIREMGQMGANILINRLNRLKNGDDNEGLSYKSISLDSKLVLRESVSII